MLFAAGLIAKTRRSAMETVKMSFGKKGSLLFCILNILQLVGWTAIMIYDGAMAANGIFNTYLGLVSCDRRPNYPVDRDRNQQSRED